MASVTPVGDSFYVTAWHLGDVAETYTYIVVGDVFEPTPGPGLLSGIRVGERSYAPGSVTYSTTNGRSWQAHSGPMAQAHAIAHGDGTFVCVGELNTIHASADLDEWTLATTPLEYAWFPDVAFGAGRFVAAGDEVIHSTDGIDWEQAASAGSLRAIVYAEFNDKPAPPRVPCPADHPGEICGDTYCEYCEDGALYRCATIEREGDTLPLCSE